METELLVSLVQGSPDWHHEMEDPASLESGLAEEKNDHSTFAAQGDKATQWCLWPSQPF